MLLRVIRRSVKADLPGQRTGQLGWAGRVVTLLAAVLGVAMATVPVATANPTTITDGGTGLAVKTGDGHVFQAPVARAVSYVALGDSYSSGVGTGVYDPARKACARSPLSYPPRWAEQHPANLGFVACSGAKTADVLANQISTLQPSTELVTITVGGNDAGFGPVLQTCTVARSDRTCAGAVDASEAFERSVLRDRLTRAYAEIRRTAPRARVIVLGYPRLFELTPNCAEPQVPNLARRKKLNEGADVLNEVIQSASQQFRFGFIDVRTRFTGHGVCSANPWINGPSVSTSVGPYHPNQTGYRNGYLDALNVATARGAATA